jgi:hypothetical protein
MGRSYPTACSEEWMSLGAATQGSYALMEDCRPILFVWVHLDSAQILGGFHRTG